jgi:rod shape-determining protein MreD
MALGALDSQAAPRLDNAAARLLPIATTTAAALFMLLPVRIPGYAALVPAFTLMAAYHWTIYRPDLLPPLFLFLLGAAQDLLGGAPLGSSSLVLLLARAGVLKYRRQFVNRRFPFIWAGFTTVTGGATVLFCLSYCFLEAALPEFRGTLFRAVLTISLFPVASFLLGRTQRALMGAG